MGQPKHTPVLLDEVLAILKPKPGDHYLDLTAGFGGHALAIASLVGEKGSITLVDRDQAAVEHLKNLFINTQNVKVIHSDFLSVSKDLYDSGQKYDVILADLGVSSAHFDSAERGFSFSKVGPLDMRMDRRQKFTAADVINESSEQELADILKSYGEIKKSTKLAKKIVQSRPIEDTVQLAGLVEKETRFKGKPRVHPATKVFQALRIAVNDELTQLNQSLPIWIELLKTGGRLGVISFHSLEDRLVKQAFQEYGGDRYDAKLQTVTKKPVKASIDEIVYNPRARSALLRCAQRK